MNQKEISFTEDQLKQMVNADLATTLNDPNERKKLTVIRRMEIAESIQDKYSMLKKPKGILHEQLFSAMEEYLKTCIETGYKIEGL